MQQWRARSPQEPASVYTPGARSEYYDRLIAGRSPNERRTPGSGAEVMMPVSKKLRMGTVAVGLLWAFMISGASWTMRGSVSAGAE